MSQNPPYPPYSNPNSSPYGHPGPYGQHYPGGGAGPYGYGAGGGGPDALLGRARRAGILSMVIGVLMLLCDGAVIFHFVTDPEALAQLQNMPNLTGQQFSPQMLSAALYVFLGLGALLLLLLIGMGALTCRGSKVPAVINIILESLATLYLLCNGVFALLASPVAALILVLTPLGLLIWSIIWNAQAVKAISQYQTLVSYTHYQMQQGYAQPYGGYPAQQQWQGQPAQQWPGQQQQPQWPPPSPPPQPQSPQPHSTPQQPPPPEQPPG